MDDLEALFDSVDGFKEDLLDFGVAGLGALGANMAWDMVEAQMLSRLHPALRAGAAIVAGVAGGAFLSQYSKNIATGVAVGLAARGLGQLAKTYLPTVTAVAGLGMTVEERALLMPGVASATTQIEEVAGLSAAPATVEEVSALNGMDGDAALAATLN